MNLVSLVNNITLLISISIVYSFISRRWNSHTSYHRILTGLLFGLTAIIGMLTPAQAIPGIIFDGRTIILAVTGLFTGGLATIIAMVIAMAYRISIGGPGIYMGVSTIITSGGIGLFFAYLRQRKIIQYNWVTLLSAGIVVHIAMFLCTLLLPTSIRYEITKGLIIPLTTIYPIGVLLVGNLFLNQEQRIKSEQDLVSSQNSYENLVENVKSVIIKLNKEAQVIFINNHGIEIFGFETNELMDKMPLDTFIEKEDPAAKYFSPLGCSLIQVHESITVEGVSHTKSGDKLFLIWTFTAYTTDDGTDEILCIGNNVTSLKGIQNALRESKQILKNIMDNTKDFICQIDNEGNHLFVNRSYTTGLGYAPDDLIGKPIIDFVHPEDRAIVIDSFKSVLMKKDNYLLTFRFRNANGEYTWIESIATTTYDSDGNVTGAVASSRDIAERMEQQKALEYSELRYKALLFAIPDILFVQSMDGFYLDVHCSDPSKLLLPTEEFLGKHYSDVLPQYIIEKFEEKFELIKKKSQVELFEYSTEHNSSVLYFVARIAPFGKDKFITIIRDITDRKTAETQVKIEEEKYRLLAENSSDVIWRMDAATQKITYVSPSVFKLRGYTPEEAMAQTLEESMDKESFQQIQSELPGRIHDFITGKEGARTSITQIQQSCKDGSWKWVEIATNIVTNEKGEISEIIGVSRDITLRKKDQFELLENEQQLKQQNEEYLSINEELNESNTTIQAINEELTLAKEKAEESDRLKSAFLANMSHEIRTPMNGILGFADLLRRPNLSSEKSAKYIDIINTNGHQLLSIINDIIDISKIEAKLIHVEQHPVNIGDLTNALNDQFKPLAKAKGISFDAVNQFNTTTVVLTDEVKLKQIIFNLIGNALKFTHSGNIKVSVIKADANLLFSIKDTGIGIPKSHHELIFERFRQVETTITQQYGGTGLGLSISRSLVELLGGNIWLESKEGEGSNFIFSIPCIEIEDLNTKIAPQKDYENINLSGKIILIAEDEENNFLYLQEILQPTEVTVIRAKNGEEAVRLAQTKPTPNLILMDIKMPILDGFEATMKIRSTNASIPIIAQTAYATPSDRNKAINAGCNGFLAKPISSQLLLQIVCDYIC
ncbi:PAS domain S-box protein [Williamwhitmania taraxaci]|uniref:histidine kinase n=1 Tax=Williamwhitmania taraxaci TaxID=1640674 RepID=A0A1G6I2C5_9BACT|nr:PAS domain S-box protein [Williamwhitmania taraxaci]SDC00225.1 hypothetical protein SAMN05216323_101422 [Williamwhitmania taraxaci]